MRVRAALGRFGEDVAVQHLERAGLVILERNWRCASGEIDIIARDGPVIVFVEVKTRSSRAFGDPFAAVDVRKAGRIRAVATQWLAQRRAADPDHRFSELRFDVVSVMRDRRDGVVVDRIAAAF